VVRVVEIVSEAELASQQQAQKGGTGAPVTNSAPATPASSSSRVPLPPMEPLPSSGAAPVQPSGGASTSPVR
jgi:hypothetical protein